MYHSFAVKSRNGKAGQEISCPALFRFGKSRDKFAYARMGFSASARTFF